MYGDGDAALLAPRTFADDAARLLQAVRVAGRVAEPLGDSKRVAADHSIYALTDYREVDRSIALARAKAV